jgi:hypothetical protein
MFDTLETSLTVLEQLAPLETKLRQRRKSLADEVGRAADRSREARQRAVLIAPICSAAPPARPAS